ncbi:MAG TPA: PEP-CTERM sorting domain-containing protein, partial [Pseudoduganella sp.]
GPTLSLGEKFSGYVDIDMSMPVLREITPGRWVQYETMGSTTQMHIENAVGTFTFQSVPKIYPYQGTSVSVANADASAGTDRFSYRAYGSYDTGYSNFVDFRLEDPTGAAVSNTSLPPSLNLQLFPNATFSTTWMPNEGPNGGKEFVFTAQITSMQSISAVPEPASWSALLAGFAVISAASARSARRKQ